MVVNLVIGLSCTNLVVRADICADAMKLTGVTRVNRGRNGFVARLEPCPLSTAPKKAIRICRKR